MRLPERPPQANAKYVIISDIHKRCHKKGTKKERTKLTFGSLEEFSPIIYYYLIIPY